MVKLHNKKFVQSLMKGVHNTKMKAKTQKAAGRNKIRKESPGERVFDFFNVIFLVAVSIIAVYPLWHVLCTSLSNATEISMRNGMLIFPVARGGGFGVTLNAYKQMFTHPLIVPAYGNTIFIVVASTALNIVMTAICAYVLSREKYMMKKFFTVVVMFTMFFNGGMIPTYIVYTKVLGLNNSYLALILPGAISIYNMIIMRTNFESIPVTLNEAASLDGAGHMRMLFQIVLPLSKAIIAVMVLYYGVTHWNDWFQASIYLQDRKKFPLQLILKEILIQNDTNAMADSASAAAASDMADIGETIKYATIVFATVPILCVYPFLQKYFTKGVMVGAVKG